jgi:hypothetical protein
MKNHKVVSALPSPLEADSVYYVRVADGFDLYVTNSSGGLFAYTPNYQPKSANLAALAGLVGEEDVLPYFTGEGAMSLTGLTGAARLLLNAADAEQQREVIGVPAPISLYLHVKQAALTVLRISLSSDYEFGVTRQSGGALTIKAGT